MGLKIAQKIKCENHFKSVPTTSDIVSTLPAANEPSYPTNRHIRHAQQAEDNYLTIPHENEYLPKYFYDGGGFHSSYGDKEWILSKLRRIKTHQQKRITAHQYAEIFKEAYDCELITYRKEGKARFVANKWLLLVTK